MYKRQHSIFTHNSSRLVLQKILDHGQTAREGILTKNDFFVADNVVPVSYTHLYSSDKIEIPVPTSCVAPSVADEEGMADIVHGSQVV